ncbi:DNA polymerase III subunit chi [Sphingomicrobium nitratireducens]|uniref:DNA polymerase III subunit chi n=1 Tax=Sphingomicrobium nitratireducens TaxID=2964666 RepID=UPI00223FC942
MRVDFYQLAGEPAASILAAIAARLMDQQQRLLVVSNDEAQIGALGRQLWEEGEASFLAHGSEGGPHDQHQPILLSTRTVAANRARNIAIVDGEWRAPALQFDRVFYIFDGSSLDAAREAWRSLGREEGVERHYWAREEGRWTEKG